MPGLTPIPHTLSDNEQSYSTPCLSFPLQNRQKKDMTCPISCVQALTRSSLADFWASSNKHQRVVCADRRWERAQHSPLQVRASSLLTCCPALSISIPLCAAKMTHWRNESLERIARLLPMPCAHTEPRAHAARCEAALSPSPMLSAPDLPFTCSNGHCKTATEHSHGMK